MRTSGILCHATWYIGAKISSKPAYSSPMVKIALFYLENITNRIVRNVGTHVPNYVVSHCQNTYIVILIFSPPKLLLHRINKRQIKTILQRKLNVQIILSPTFLLIVSQNVSDKICFVSRGAYDIWNRFYLSFLNRT
jgi:hypothetical protein